MTKENYKLRLTDLVIPIEGVNEYWRRNTIDSSLDGGELKELVPEARARAIGLVIYNEAIALGSAGLLLAGLYHIFN